MKVSGYVRKTVDYAVGDLFNKILLILFLPIFTHFLVPEEFAIYINLMIFFSVASMIYLLGIQQAIFSYFYNKKTNQYQFALISSVYILLTIVGLLFSTFIIIFRSELAQFSIRSNTHQHLFIYLAVILFFNTIYGITLSFLHIMEKSRSYALLSALQNVIVLILIAVFALKKQFTVDHYFIFLSIATVISAVVASIVILKILSKLNKNSQNLLIFDPELIKNLLKFGVVIIPGTISMLILRASDRYMLTYLSPNNLHDVGIYSVGYRMGMIMQFLVALTSLVYYPYAMKIANRKTAKESYNRIYNYYIMFGTILGSLIIIFSQELFKIFIDAQYIASINIVFIGVISTFLLGVFNIINISFYVKKHAGNISLAVILGAILNIILNFILIPSYGIYGAGIASVLAYLFIVIFNFTIAKRLHDIQYNIMFILIAIMVLSISAKINSYLPLSWIVFAVKIMITIVIAALIIYYYRKNDNLRLILKIIKQKGENEI